MRSKTDISLIFDLGDQTALNDSIIPLNKGLQKLARSAKKLIESQVLNNLTTYKTTFDTCFSQN